MGNVFTKVRFSRCREVMETREAAMIHLREREFMIGEPAIVNYIDVRGNESLNTIMAVGVKNGKGPDCFKIITLGQYEIVWGVGRELPDASDVAHGELYLWQDRYGVWWYVSGEPQEGGGVDRKKEPLLPYPHTFLNIVDNTVYVSDLDCHVRSICDVYTKSEIDDLLAAISGGEFSSLSTLEQRLNEAYLRINEVAEQNAELTEVIQGMQDSLEIVQEFGEKVEEFETKVSCLEVDPDSGEVTGTFSSIQIEDPENSNIVIDKDTVVTAENIDSYLGEGHERIPLELLDQELTY